MVFHVKKHVAITKASSSEEKAHYKAWKKVK